MKTLRTKIFEAIGDAIHAGAEQADYHDIREVDRLATAVMMTLSAAGAAPVARVNDQFSREGYNDEIDVFLPVGTQLYFAPVDAAHFPMAQAAADVLAERRRQVEQEGYDTAHDDEHVNDEIAAYATFYAMPPGARDWPAEETGFGATWGEAIIPENWGPGKPGDRRGELIKAGALIVAEIERLDRAAAPQKKEG